MLYYTTLPEDVFLGILGKKTKTHFRETITKTGVSSTYKKESNARSQELPSNSNPVLLIELNYR